MRATISDRACALHERAVTFRAAGNAAGARRACLQAIALFERASGRSHPDVANVLLELAGAELDLGKLADAARSVTRATTILAPLARTLRGDIDIARLRVQALVRKSELQVARGAYRSAEAPCKQAIRIAENEIKVDEDIAFALNALGVVYKYTSRFDEAEPIYRRALALTVRTRGRSDPEVASILHNLGGLEHSRRRFARAEPYARRSVAIRERALGPDHPTVAADVAALAAILDGRGKREEAEALLRRAIDTFARTLGKQHFEVGFNLGQLAAVCHASGRLAEASRLYTRAIRILRKALGARHPVLTSTLANFAQLRQASGTPTGP
jgi:tetratricopeptide (TPR) repeat protein